MEKSADEKKQKKIKEKERELRQKQDKQKQKEQKKLEKEKKRQREREAKDQKRKEEEEQESRKAHEKEEKEKQKKDAEAKKSRDKSVNETGKESGGQAESSEDSEKASEEMSGLSGLINQISDSIIRPPRSQYTLEDMEPRTFTLPNDRRSYERTDLQVTNARGLKLSCSWWQPQSWCRAKQKLPCVVYMHGNCGCRANAFEILPYILPLNATVFAFDFAGCGHSEGEYISLGYFEQEDLRAVLKYLTGTGTVSHIGLWGRSMGAATALMYCGSQSSRTQNQNDILPISGMVLDSPFSSLQCVAQELVDAYGVKVPTLMVKMGLKMVRKNIKKRAHFDIELTKGSCLEPIKKAPHCTVPVLFFHGEQDNFVLPHHSRDLFAAYGGRDKAIQMVQGDHNSSRPAAFLQSTCEFWKRTLLVGEDECLLTWTCPGRPSLPRDPGPPKRSREDLLKMKVSELKQILAEMRIQYGDCVEKVDLVDRILGVK